jgi:hypothetical protein
MYSICFKASRPHPACELATFIEYIQSLGIGRISRVRRVLVHDGTHFFVHFSWFGDDLLRDQLDAGVQKFLFIWPNGNPARGMDFSLHKTSIPSDMVPGLPLIERPLFKDCHII